MKKLIFVLWISIWLSQSVHAQNSASEKKLTADQLFETDRLIEIDINVPAENWDAIRTQSRDFASSLGKELEERPFTWTKGDITIDGVSIKNVGIRKKGFFGSISSERRGFLSRIAFAVRGKK